MLQDRRYKEEGEKGTGEPWRQKIDPLILGLDAVTYSAQDMHECEQEWQEAHQQELLDVQQ